MKSLNNKSSHTLNCFKKSAFSSSSISSSLKLKVGAGDGELTDEDEDDEGAAREKPAAGVEGEKRYEAAEEEEEEEPAGLVNGVGEGVIELEGGAADEVDRSRNGKFRGTGRSDLR